MDIICVQLQLMSFINQVCFVSGYIKLMVIATQLVTGITFILFCIEYKLQFTVQHDS